MGKRYLIDSNTLIEYIGLLLPPAVHYKVADLIDEEFNISFINKIEVLGHSSINKEIEDFINAAVIFNINDPIIQKTILLRRDFRIKLPDAIVAATALINDLTLITRNTSDFKSIGELKAENPWEWESLT